MEQQEQLQNGSSPSPAQEGTTSSAGSTSTADPAATSPPPLPFALDPTQRQPAPTLGSQERRPQQAQQPEQAGEKRFPGVRRVGPWVGVVLGSLVLVRCSGLGGGTTVVNNIPNDQPAASTTTTQVSQVPMRAVPVGAKIGNFPVRDSALMVINGEIERATVAALDYIARNPGVGVCNLYVGATFGNESGYIFSGARTEEAEVKLVDCSTGPDGPVATTAPVQDSVPTTTAPVDTTPADG